VISEELRAEIRRKFFAERWKVGTIASTLRVHHTTVEHAVEESGKVRVLRQKQSVLEPYRGFIADTLKSYPKLLGTRVLAMIAVRGYTGGVATVRRYLRTIRPTKQPEAFFPDRETSEFFRLTALPAEEAQVDWGEFGQIRVGNTMRALSCFVMVLSYSRAMYARFVLDMSMETLPRGKTETLPALSSAGLRVVRRNVSPIAL